MKISTISLRLLSIGFTLLIFGTILMTACKTDKCEGIICENQGTCVEGLCNCLVGFEGKNCEQSSNSIFIGSNIKADNLCTPNLPNAFHDHLADFERDMSNPSRLLIHNFGNYKCSGQDLTLSVIISKGLFDINFDNCGYKITGSGKVETVGSINKKLTITYVALYGTKEDKCTIVYEM